MRNGRQAERRKLSAGTVFMLILLAVVLGGSVLVLGRLSSGASVDLSKLSMNVLDLQEDASREQDDDTPAAKPETKPQTAKKQETPAAETTARKQETGFTLTVGGSISLSGEVRKNSQSTDSKVADYADIMMLLAPQISSDVNIVFLENILSDRHKASDTVAPGQAATLLKEAGFDMAACGFAQAYGSGRDGVEATLMTLDRQGVTALGIRYADDPGRPQVRTFNGVKAAFLQYTNTLSVKARNTMEKDGTTGMVPEADIERISQDIDLARQQGAEAVIILLNWGKIGNNQDKKQRDLAESIATAGADLIIGNGSHLPQTAEYLNGKDGRSVLCVYSLGALLCGDRNSIKRMSGYLLHVTVRSDGQGGALVLNPEYMPVYTWKYKQDSRFYYRCIVSDGEAPDGMDSEQRKTMAKSAEMVAAALKDAPLSERGHADGS